MSKKKLVVGITSPSSIILIEGQLSYFSNNGYDVYLLSPYSEDVVSFCEKEKCTHLDIDLDRDINLLKDFKSLYSIFRILKSIKPDIVNLGTPKIALLGMIAAFVLRIKKRIYTCRGFRFEHELGFKRWLLIFFEKITVKCSHVVICISPSVKEKGLSLGIFRESMCYVINKGSSNGFDLSKFSVNNVSEYKINLLKKELALEGRFLYGFVGRIIDRKGINELYESFCDLSLKYPNISLLIVGDFECNQICDKSIINKLESHPNICLVGFQKDVIPYIKLMDVFVLPAWWEGFGNVLVQAAALGVPVISTFGTGTCDAVNDRYNGILVPVKDVCALENAMRFLYNNHDVLVEYGKNGIEWSKNFKNVIIWEGMRLLYN